MPDEQTLFSSAELGVKLIGGISAEASTDDRYNGPGAASDCISRVD